MNEGLTRRDFLWGGGAVLTGAWAFGLAGCGTTDAGGSGKGGGGGGEGGSSGWEPSRNVVMIVPFEAGGGSDILGRAIASGLEEVRPGVNVSVENRAGGSGAVGYSYLLEQEGNPHILLASETTGVALPLTTEVAWSWTDFTPVAQIGEDAILSVVDRDAPYESYLDLVEAAKKGRITVGVAGATSEDSIVASLVEQDQGVEFERVVFDSGGEIVAALLGGDIDTASLNPGEVIGQLEAGDLRALAVFAEERYEQPQLADVPTAKEQGVDVTFVQYRGTFAPGGISPEERKYWADAHVEWTNTESYEQYIDDNYLISVVRVGEEFADYLVEYEKTLRGVLSDSGDQG